MSRQVEVLYIAGNGRSGSTIIGNLLGQVPGFCSVGEVHHLWERGVIQNWTCGCGERFRSCAVWQEVVAAVGASDARRAAELLEQDRSFTRLRHLPLLVLSRWAPRIVARRASGYLDQLDRVYRALAEATGCDVVVDSSKSPNFARLLDLTPSVRLRVVHLVRDPRGVAHSLGTVKHSPDRGGGAEVMDSFGPAKTAALWSLWNLAIDLLWGGDHDRYLRVRYEDFASDPSGVLSGIVEFAGRPAADLPFLVDGIAHLAPTHTFSGNPDRMKSDGVAIRADERWVEQMGSRSRRIVSVLAAFGIVRYGYGGRRRQKAPLAACAK